MKVTVSAVYAALSLISSSAVAIDTLPPESPYLGKIRRDADGKLIAVPESTPASTGTPGSTTTMAPVETSLPVAEPSVQQAVRQETSVPVRIPKTIRVGKTQAIISIAVAAQMAKDGDTIEIDAGDYYGDVALWTQDRLTIRGVGKPGERARLIAAGNSVEGKAIFVIRGGQVTVENIEFSGTRVKDGNGAGIRFEKGHLTVRNCRFTDNETGLLTAGGDAELTVENSEFDHNGGAREGYTHGLYAGTLRKLTVTGSYFHHGKKGQLLKSRALENHILYNRLTDEIDGQANYELEFSNGGIAYVIGNLIQQSSGTTNSAIVSFGPEGYKHPRNELYFINNTLDDQHPCCGIPLKIRPGAHQAKVLNNLVISKTPLQRDNEGQFANNHNVNFEPFVLAQRQDYRIKRDSPLQRNWSAPGSANGIDLTPTREYAHPLSTRPLAGNPTLPGALQTLQ
jgi:hypothetical protein